MNEKRSYQAIMFRKKTEKNLLYIVLSNSDCIDMLEIDPCVKQILYRLGVVLHHVDSYGAGHGALEHYPIHLHCGALLMFTDGGVGCSRTLKL